MIKINKATFRDLDEQAEGLGLGRLSNLDEEYLYFTSWSWNSDGGFEEAILKKYKYSWVDGILDVDKESGKSVVKSTTYVDIPEPIEKRLSFIEKFLKPFTSKDKETPIIKQFDEESLIVHEPLYTPANVIDGHGDFTDEDGVVRLTKALNDGVEAGTIQPSLFHKTKTKSFTIGKSWYLEQPSKVGDQVLPAYTPMVEITMKSKKLFEARVSGKIAGLSIGALAKGEVLKEFQQNFIGAKRKLTDFSFLHKGAHLSYTDWSVGGAASKINDVYEVVSKSMDEKLTAGQEEILLFLEEEYDPIDKQLQDRVSEELCEESPSTPQGAQDAGVDNKTLINKGKETNNMSDPVKSEELSEALSIQKEFEAYKKSIKIEKSLSKYGFSEEDASGLATALASAPEEVEVAVNKALDALVEMHTSKLEEVNKQQGTQTNLDPLKDKVDKELGHAEEQDEEVEKSLNEVANEKLKERLAKHEGAK